MNVRSSMIAMVLVALASSATQAETLVTYLTFGQPGDQETTPGVAQVAGLTAIDMVRGAGLSPNMGNNSFNSAGWTGEETDFIEFGFSVDTGLFTTLDSLFIGSRSSNTGPGTIGVFTSLDGFANEVFSIQQSGTSFTNSIIDFSGLGPIVGDFTVRLIQIGTTSAGGGTTGEFGTFRVGDFFSDGEFTTLQFTGTVGVIPEPSSIVLMGLGVAGLVGVARLRRRAR